MKLNGVNVNSKKADDYSEKINSCEHNKAHKEVLNTCKHKEGHKINGVESETQLGTFDRVSLPSAVVSFFLGMTGIIGIIIVAIIVYNSKAQKKPAGLLAIAIFGPMLLTMITMIIGLLIFSS